VEASTKLNKIKQGKVKPLGLERLGFLE